MQPERLSLIRHQLRSESSLKDAPFAPTRLLSEIKSKAPPLVFSGVYWKVKRWWAIISSETSISNAIYYRIQEIKAIPSTREMTPENR
jgi:hypothetical protein